MKLDMKVVFPQGDEVNLINIETLKEECPNKVPGEVWICLLQALRDYPGHDVWEQVFLIEIFMPSTSVPDIKADQNCFDSGFRLTECPIPGTFRTHLVQKIAA